LLPLDPPLEGGRLPVVREQLLERPRIDHGARDGVAGDLPPLLQDGDRQLQSFALVAHACDFLPGDATKPSRRDLKKPVESGGGMLPWRPSAVMETNLTAGPIPPAVTDGGGAASGERLRLSHV